MTEQILPDTAYRAASINDAVDAARQPDGGIVTCRAVLGVPA